MGKLTEAIYAAEERKDAVLGDIGQGIAYTNEDQTRAMLSGWDIDFEEFKEISQRAGHFFARGAFQVPLPDVCRSAWGDGLLVGLMLASRE